MKLPRILLAAPSSGSGKTLITCGILQALTELGFGLAAFKCGPDYIDPMFHGRVLGISSKNLDTYFTSEETTRYLFGKEAAAADLSIMEGVMGYYDGVAGTSTRASAYDLARVTQTPVILVVDTKGMSGSVTALLKGFLTYKEDSNIKGVILNRMTESLFNRVKEMIERELPIRVLGYVPEAAEYVIESRHLGLVTPGEITGLKEKLAGLSGVLKKTLDFDLLINIAKEAPELSFEKPNIPRLTQGNRVKIGIAQDLAFCFYYRDNLELMTEIGADIVFFSPLTDEKLPQDLDGLIFYGGYPELYAKQLSINLTMLEDISKSISEGMPYLAECGGFMYLHERMEDMEGQEFPMVGAVPGKVFRTKRLGRFGYIEVTAASSQILGQPGIKCKAHEFHYFDSTNNGSSFYAKKPCSERGWSCIHADAQCAVGFPHLYYYSNPKMIYHFLEVCQTRGEKHVDRNH